MSEKGFFAEIAHEVVPWRGHELHVPVFYRDMMFMSLSFQAPLDRIAATLPSERMKPYRILPSERMKPYRIMPGKSVLTITTYIYRDSDVGAYNEVGISIPVTMDRPTPIFTGSLRRGPSTTMLYVWRMPVTTELARLVGVEFAGYPKFVADIEFCEDPQWLTCSWQSEGQQVLTVRGRKLETNRVGRSRYSPLNVRKGRILRSELVMSGCEVGSSRDPADAQIELGDHKISEELLELGLGRMLSYSYCSHTQAVLTQVFESYAI